MNERTIIIDNVDPVAFYGVNNSHLQLIKSLYPKLRIAARGQVIKALGSSEETADFEEKIKQLEAWCTRYNKLTDDAIIDIVKG